MAAAGSSMHALSPVPSCRPPRLPLSWSRTRTSGADLNAITGADGSRMSAVHVVAVPQPIQTQGYCGRGSGGDDGDGSDNDTHHATASAFQDYPLTCAPLLVAQADVISGSLSDSHSDSFGDAFLKAPVVLSVKDQMVDALHSAAAAVDEILSSGARPSARSSCSSDGESAGESAGGCHQHGVCPPLVLRLRTDAFAVYDRGSSATAGSTVPVTDSAVAASAAVAAAVAPPAAKAVTAASNAAQFACRVVRASREDFHRHGFAAEHYGERTLTTSTCG